MFIENNILATQRLITEYERHNNIIIGVDFDDTINDTFNKGHVNIPVLVDVLKQLQQDFNCTLCVWTANQDESKVRTRWEELGLRIDHYNTSPLADKFPGPKPYFNILLDDRAGLDSSSRVVINLLKHLLTTKIRDGLKDTE